MATSKLPLIFAVEDKGTGPRHLLSGATINFVEEELNGPGQAEVSFDPLTSNANEVLLGERELEIQEGSDLIFAGPMRDLTGNSTRLTLKADGLFDYFKFRFVLQGNLAYVDTEQQAIAAALVTYAQSDADQGTNADLNISISGFSSSGILRTREYVSERKHNLFEVLGEFATLDEGFDMAIVLTPAGARIWTPYFPNQGTVKAVPLEYGREIIDYSYHETATKLATKVAATGGVAEQIDGERLKQEFTFEDIVASARYGVHTAVLPSGSRSDLAWLESRATQAVNARKDPLTLPEMTCKNAKTLRTLIKVGDVVPLRVDHGRVQFAGDFRIQKIRWEPPSDTLKLTFLEPVDA